MPDMDGNETTAEIRSTPALADLPDAGQTDGQGRDDGYPTDALDEPHAAPPK